MDSESHSDFSRAEWARLRSSVPMMLSEAEVEALRGANEPTSMVEVEEVFHHCAKAFLRSQLWQPETWHDPDPSRPVIAKTLDAPNETLEDLTVYYGEQYREKLYR